MATYPIKVRARNRIGGETILCRLGGGGNTLAEAGTRYYPTVLWFEDRAHQRGAPKYFHPGEREDLWKGGGPDFFGPYTLIEVLQEWSGDDPMGAADTWPIAAVLR